MTDVWLSMAHSGSPAYTEFVGYFLKLQQYEIKRTELMDLNSGGTQVTRASAAQAAMYVTWAGDVCVKTTMSLPISSWIQQVTPK